jgi:GNAT superfamily N-acetyltransferase
MNIFVRPATPEDSPLAGELILATMGEFGKVIYGLDDRNRAVQALGQMFTFSDNRFSYKKTVIAEVEGQPAGMLLAFPGRELSQLERSLLREMPAIYPLKDLLRLAWRYLPMLPGTEAEKDEYYIAHVAVLPQYQGLGIARNLMALAEKQCHQAGLEKCSLCVDFGHDTARQLYLKLGYQIVKSIIHPPLIVWWLKWGGYERMVKVIQ